MSRNRFNVNNRSASVSLANGFGAKEQDTSPPLNPPPESIQRVVS